MGNSRACSWCRVGRYNSDPRKQFRDSHLCFNCSIICDLNVQHLVPASERKPTSIDPFGRSGYHKAIPFNSRLGMLTRVDKSIQTEMNKLADHESN
jgi:5-methylcytosine-specific restriction endonuclease McrA